MATMADTGGVTTDKHTVVGIFDGPGHAEQALNKLQAGGFTPAQVSVVARDNAEVTQLAEHTDMVAEGAGTGAVTGGLLGGLGGFFLGISAMVIPGIGPIVGAGIIAATLAGAGIGAAAGGLIGALTAQGVSAEDAAGYQERVRAGSILLTIHAESDEQAQHASDIFDASGGGSVRRYAMKV